MTKCMLTLGKRLTSISGLTAYLLTVVLMSISLSGCLGKTVRPPVPSLQASIHPEDPQGRCLTGPNMERLMNYIHALEDGYR
jgi:hypothetical protein